MFVQLLLWAGILSLITYFLDQTQPSNLYGALVLFLVSILMCIFSFLEEKKALTVIRGFHNLLPQVANVIRDAQESTIAAENLVVGDIVRLNSGVKVPADLRLLTCNSLKLETSALTGESKAIDYTSDPADSGVFDAHNVAFNGSFCLDGDGLGLVIRTGDKTMIGQIAKLTNQQKDHKTLLQIEIARFVRFIAFLSVGMGAVIFAIAIGIEAATGPKLTAAKVLSLFINGFLTILVANIPEGLPATVTSQLTIIARRMAKLNVYTKRLDIVETLGAATVIASDKTGTLTTNTMTVTDLWFNNQFSAGAPEAKTRSVVKKMNKGEVHTYLDLLDFPLPELLTAMVVCNKAAIEVDSAMKIVSSPPKLTTQKSLEEGTQRVMLQRSPSALARFTIRGSPSEAALLRFCEQMFSTSEIREEHDIVFEIPFNSSRKWHLVITKKSSVSAKRQNDLAHFTLTMKGAPEILIKLCTEWASESGFQLIDSDFTQDFEDAYMHFGKEGRRLIAFCSKVFEAPAGTKFDSQEMNFPTEGLCFLGMAAIIDPPRAETKHAILSCRAAGIKVFMVTGDHPVTAVAIAKQIALIAPYDVMRAVHREETEIVVQNPEFDDESEEDHVIHGDELATLSDAQWDKIIARKSMVFARTTPEQKLLIVEQLQKRGEVVAVTGDGVNDAPALKRADIGVAMGKAGSDVAKQAADIVLMDDNFASIVKGIEQGRLMFANIRKTIAYTMSHMPPEIFLTIMNLIFGFPVALTSLQVLSIDLGSELAPAISLAYETPESDIMSEPPRKKTARLVNKRLLLYSYIFMGFLFSITAWAAYAAIYIYHGIPVRLMLSMDLEVRYLNNIFLSR